MNESNLDRSPASQNAALKLLLKYVQEPLLRLDSEWHAPVFDFWAYWSLQLRDGQLALTSRLRHWIEDGLTLPMAVKVFKRMTTPEASASLTYGHEVLAKLSTLVTQELASAKAQEENANRIPFGRPRGGGPDGYGLAAGLDQILNRAKKGAPADASQRQ
jgi:hypothetical protein